MAAAPAQRYIAVMPFSPFDHDRAAGRPRRFRLIPVRMLLPNLITLLALCAGLTAIRLAVEDRLEWAVAAIVFAALLDGIDGRIARLLKGTSRFGAELDSLADFVNFGVAPALMVYFWSLHELKSAGWIAAMVFAICTGLRLARFNVMVDDPNKPVWAGNFFVGIPAPAGAITVLLPIYVYFLGMPRFAFMAPVTLVYTLAIAFLMVSRLPVFSGKRVGKRVAPEMVLPVFVAVVLFFALLVAYPWVVLTIGTVAYLASLPIGWIAYREYRRRDAAAALQAPARSGPHAPVESESPSLSPGHPEQPPHPERPARLNGRSLPRHARACRGLLRLCAFAELKARMVEQVGHDAHCLSAGQRMPRHEVIGVLPAWQRLDAIEPSRDIFMLPGNVESEFVCRIIEVGDQRQVGDGRTFAQHEWSR